jgi:hypothetical protein
MRGISKKLVRSTVESATIPSGITVISLYGLIKAFSLLYSLSRMPAARSGIHKRLKLSPEG